MVESLACDVLLLTEMCDRLDLPDYTIHRTSAPMAAHRTWAAVASREPLTPLPDLHSATALAASSGWTFASSVLPWRACSAEPWGGGGHADKTRRTLDTLLAQLPSERLIWGGDPFRISVEGLSDHDAYLVDVVMT